MSYKKLNIVVVGATGYVGLDLILLLSKHPHVSIKYLCAQKNLGKKIQFFDKRIKKKLPLISNLNKVLWHKVDVLFLSLPDGEAQKLVNQLYTKHKHLKFIDLSGDFRISNINEYFKWYSIKHSAKNLIEKSIYSVSEFSKNSIKNYRIVSNPGCYPTSIQLALLPLLKNKLIKKDSIIIDAKSGFSGAGKNYKRKFKHKNLNKSIQAYNVSKHKHMSELDQEFRKFTNKINYSFTPHLLPTFRGILSTIYINTYPKITAGHIHNKLKVFHKKNKFVKILPLNSSIGTGNVINTNNCEISICSNRVKNQIVIFSAIDNLIKGASGQAIQNMNLLFNKSETLGLE